MHIYGKDQQAFHLQRTEAERWWSRLNIVVVIVQLACFLAAIIRTSTNAGNSMSNSFFAISPLQLKDPYLVEGCVYVVTRTHAFFRNVTYTMRPDNVGYFVSRGALNIRYLMAITAVHIVVSMLNRLWFETNTHEIRYHFVVFRKDMVTTWEVLLMVLGMVMTWSVTKENQIMTEYLTACGSVSGGAYYNSVQPYTELVVSYIVSIAITVINALFAIWNLSDENPRDKMMKEDKKRREEWERAMREYYGLPDPAAASANGEANDTSNGHGTGVPLQQQPQQQLVTYGENRAATAGARHPEDAHHPPPSQQQQHHHHNYHHAIRKGLQKPFAAVSNSLRGRSQQGDPVVAAQKQQHHPHHQARASPMRGGPPPAATEQQQQQQQQQRLNQGLATHEPPHVGPSVSRPLTPLLNEEYDEDYGEADQQQQQQQGELQVPAPAGGRTPNAPPIAQHPPHGSSSHSGRYDLHEVEYDDEPYDSVEMDVTHSSPRGPPSSSAADNNNALRNSRGAGGSGGRRAPVLVASTSDGSTALLNARLSSVPPPPPAYAGERRQRAQNARRQMLAPPSPLQGGAAEATDDTVLQ